MIYRVDTIKLKSAMVKAGYNRITDLADASHVSRNTIADILYGDAYPSIIVMQKLIVALHLTPDEAKEIFFCFELA